MSIYLLDHSLKVNVYYEHKDCEYNDNVCVSILESCPDEERIFLYDLLNLYLTPEEARQLAEALLNAAEESCQYE
ncbi:MAG: hypothetical protein K8R77_01295 [Anaerolineaceae bacterium]|nr:hypothetical protein [Anaerolineaceae bacterium]